MRVCVESTTSDTRRTKYHEQATIELVVLLFLAVACAEPVTHRINAVTSDVFWKRLSGRIQQGRRQGGDGGVKTPLPSAEV